ncbi:PREDICTED: putative ATP-dependent RNA helicase SoYb [Drosophila arizonae]|uniref:RNA helicase n=1 Tax=Drosophila arizonae TaxID=7263 RepID=A0ABM1PRF6_DROAR|nr:PREDICTED: putative ATP-dependent RNA helicase SoYb [Drosophila arizonae]
MNAASNSGLMKPIGGIGRANLFRALESSIKLDRYNTQPLLENATLSAEINENGNLSGNEQVTNYICDDVEYTYVTPSSEDAGLDFLATCLRTKDFNTVRIVVVCELENQAAKVLKELGKRSIGCLLVNVASKAIDSGILLWNDGLLNSVLVVCDAMLKHLSNIGNIKVNFLVHYSQTLPHIFQKRVQLLIPQPAEGTKVLVIKRKIENLVQQKAGDQKNETSEAQKQTIPTAGTAQNIQNSSENISSMSITVDTPSDLDEMPPLVPIPNSEIQEVDKPTELDETHSIYAKMVPIPNSDIQEGDKPTELDETHSIAKNKIEEVNALSVSDAIYNDGVILKKNNVKQLSNNQQSSNAQKCPYSYNAFGIFTWSRTEQISRYSANDVPEFSPYLKETLRRQNIGQMRAKRVQRFAWPHAASGGSMCIIGNERIGKTWSYLPTLCQHIMLKTPPRILDNTDRGPSCIIVCVNEKEGNEIANLCMELLGTTRLDLEQVVKALSRNCIDEVVETMRKPCGILIATVDNLVKLYLLNGKTKSIFNPAALKCVAFDGIDSIWRGGRTHCQKIIYWILTVLRFEKGHSQLFVVGRLWIDSFMKPLMRELPDILLVFEDALEAAMFAGINFDFLVSNNYDGELLNILAEKQLMKKRVVLACGGNIDVSALSKLLNTKSIDNLVITRFDQETNQLYKDWCKSHMRRVLVVAEDSIDKLRGGCIDFLVHYGYSIWPFFKAQFSIFYNNYLCGIEKFRGTSVVVMRPNEFEQAWLFCDFMLKHNRHPPESFLTVLTECRIVFDALESRPDFPLCRMLKSYGNCIRHTCYFRHFLWDYETKPLDDAPTKGTIKFYVISSVNPAQTAVRLIEKATARYYMHTPLSYFGDQLQLHYESMINHPKCTKPLLNDVYVLKIHNLYQRVSIIRIESVDRIEVKQLDSGVEFYIVRQDELLICDEKFKDEPCEAYDLRITGLSPFNMERIWPDDAKKLVRHKFFEIPAKQNRVFTADINFGFLDLFFVENIYDSSGNDLNSFVLKHIPMYTDGGVHSRLQKYISEAKPSTQGV